MTERRTMVGSSHECCVHADDLRKDIASLEFQLREAEDEVEAHRRGKCGVEAAQEELHKQMIVTQSESIGAAEAENVRLRTALEWYAEGKHIRTVIVDSADASRDGKVEERITDRGEYARAALQSLAAPTGSGWHFNHAAATGHDPFSCGCKPVAAPTTKEEARDDA